MLMQKFGMLQLHAAMIGSTHASGGDTQLPGSSDDVGAVEHRRICWQRFANAYEALRQPLPVTLSWIISGDMHH